MIGKIARRDIYFGKQYFLHFTVATNTVPTIVSGPSYFNQSCDQLYPIIVSFLLIVF